jgi:zinc protease
VVIRKPGTTAYLKLAFHAPAVHHPRFVPLLLLDAALSGAKGVNLWSSFRVMPGQRQARLYRALVERGLAAAVSGAMLPTAEPFVYMISVIASDGVARGSIESALCEALDEVRLAGLTTAELDRAKRQLKARLVFDGDSVTNIAHQLGYFDTIATVDFFSQLPSAIEAVTLEAVAEAARELFDASNRTIGWFEPLGEPA